MDEFENVSPGEEKIPVYSKWAILLFSVFFSPFVGSVMLSLNLRRIGNKPMGRIVLFFGFFFTIASIMIAVKLAGLDAIHPTREKVLANKQIFYYSEAFYLLGGGILAEYFFKRYMKGSNYANRSIFPILLIMLALTFLLGSVI